MSYFVNDAGYYSRTPATLTLVERDWMDAKEVSRRVVAQGLEADSSKIAFQKRANWHRSGEFIRGDNLELEVDGGRRVNRRLPNGRTITNFVGRRLRLEIAGKAVRSWLLPEPPPNKYFGDITPFLSPDGRSAAVLLQFHHKQRSADNWSDPRRLEDFLVFERRSFEWRVFRVADGKLLVKKRFNNQARGRDNRGIQWLGELKEPLWLDGSALWFAVAPFRFPKDAKARLQEIQELHGRNTADYYQRITSLRADVRISGDMAFYDASSGHTKWFPATAPQTAPSLMGPASLSWNEVIFSPDHRLMSARLNGSFGLGATNIGIGDVYVWDVKSQRLVWHRSISESGGQISDIKFSPDGKKIAGLDARNDGVRPDVAILVFDAQTGKSLGPPLLEESPRQRAQATSARWQRPFQTGAERVTRTFASGTPTPAPRPLQNKNGFSHYEWAPDSRHILAHHGSTQLKLWRVP